MVPNCVTKAWLLSCLKCFDFLNILMYLPQIIFASNAFIYKEYLYIKLKSQKLRKTHVLLYVHKYVHTHIALSFLIG